MTPTEIANQDTVGRHCDLLEQAWKLVQGSWDAQPDDAWRTAVKKWRDAYFTLWSGHCGYKPGPAPHGFPVVAPPAPPADDPTTEET